LPSLTSASHILVYLMFELLGLTLWDLYKVRMTAGWTAKAHAL
jgi:hypothetical protein